VERTHAVDGIRKHVSYKLDTVRVNSFGDVSIFSADPALVTQRLDHGAFTTDDIARIERLVADNAAALHVHDAAKLHYNIDGAELKAIEKSSDGTTTLAIDRAWFSGSDKKVWMTLRSRQRRDAPTMPDTTKVEAKLRAQLTSTKFDRVESFIAHPCDPVGPVNTCPRSHDERTRVTIAAKDVVVGFGAIELIRSRGMALETHLIACVAIAEPPPVPPQWNASFASGGVRFEAVGGALPLPYAIDVVTGEDLTAQLHAHGGIGCHGGVVSGAGYDTGEFDDM
jgi:hypothetical protein